MKITSWLLNSTVLLISPYAIALDFGGYFRVGAGVTEQGHTQECFQLSGAASKYRLGNECEQYAEFSAEQQLIELNDDSTLALHGMLQLYNPYDQSLSFRGDNGYTRINQIYLDWQNVSYLNNVNIWLGRRYYQRNDIHMTDLFYWNQSGTGFGIDSYKINNLSLSYVFSRKDDVFQEQHINRHDVTIKDILLNQNNTLNMGVSIIDADHTGWAITVQNISQDIEANGLNAKNTVVVQYGEGAGMGLSSTGDADLTREDRSFRFIDILDWEAAHKKINGQAQLLYQKDQFQQRSSREWWSLGSRQSHIVNEQFKLTTEVGFDLIESQQQQRHLTKISIAPTWSLKGTGYYDRPELRLYYTYAHWNKNEQKHRDSLHPNSRFFQAYHGSNFGIQLESWW